MSTDLSDEDLSMDESDDDLPLELSHEERTRLFDQSYLPVHSWSGTPYPNCTTLDILSYTETSPNLKPDMLKANSTRQLTNFLHHQWPSQEILGALIRLNEARWARDWGAETIIKSLPDIDAAFFGGWLRGYFRFSWQDAHTIRSLNFPDADFASQLGVTYMDGKENICYVCLNRDIMIESIDPCKEMWETAFHELSHAYEFVTCGNLPQDSYDARQKWGGGHGWMFRWIMNLLNERTRIMLGFKVFGDGEEEYRLRDVAHWRQEFPF